jgi:Condensation domain
MTAAHPTAPRRSFRLTPEQRRRLQEELGRQGLASERTAIRPRENPHERPLSAAQQRIWFLEQLDPGSGSYNMPGAVRLRGVLDVAELRGDHPAP